MPGALEPPNSPRHLLVDSVRSIPPSATPTATAATAAPTAPSSPRPPPTPRPTATARPTATSTAGTNLALGRPATASSVEVAGLEASKAVDGNTGTRWGSAAGSDPQWITVDLGATYAISRVRLVWEAAFARA